MKNKTFHGFEGLTGIMHLTTETLSWPTTRALCGRTKHSYSVHYDKDVEIWQRLHKTHIISVCGQCAAAYIKAQETMHSESDDEVRDSARLRKAVEGMREAVETPTDKKKFLAALEAGMWNHRTTYIPQGPSGPHTIIAWATPGTAEFTPEGALITASLHDQSATLAELLEATRA